MEFPERMRVVWGGKAREQREELSWTECVCVPSLVQTSTGEDGIIALRVCDRAGSHTSAST